MSASLNSCPPSSSSPSSSSSSSSSVTPNTSTKFVPSTTTTFGTSQAQKFWKPGTLGPGSNISRDDEKDPAMIVFNSRHNLSLNQQRQLLPVYTSRRELLYAVEKYQVSIVVGATGSGKTTQVPQYLHEAGWTKGGKMIACTQPRQIAATSVATRVAEEMRVELGTEVGYAIRFDECYDPFRTKIKYLTDGMLLRETMLDPLLSQYSVIMIDEAHERSLHTDIILGLLKKIRKKRKDLRIIISSATLDAQAFKQFFETNKTNDKYKDTAVIVSVQGRQYPVTINYVSKPVRDYLKATVHTCLTIHKKQPRGDILVFLTGKEEIDQVVRAINAEDTGLQAVPLYAGLKNKDQVRAFKRADHGTRKAVIATNIAETSVTIDGIVYVVDCGFVKSPYYDPTSGVEQLLVGPICQASANQRAGRAGRTEPGVCYRLYTELDMFEVLEPRTAPEMQRANLASVVMQLKALGIDDVVHFDFMSPPPVSLLASALELLFALGALDEYCKLTDPIGTTLAEFPLEPRLGKMLLKSGEMGCTEQILSIAAMLSVPNVWMQVSRGQRANADAAKLKFTVLEGDHLTLLNVFNSFILNKKQSSWCGAHFVDYRSLKKAVDVRQQLLRYVKRFKIPLTSAEDDENETSIIRRCIVSGYFSNAAQLQGNARYKTVRGGISLVVHPCSVLHSAAAEWVVYHEVVLTTELFIRDLTVIDPMWLSEIAPHFYEYKKPTAEGYDRILASMKNSNAKKEQKHSFRDDETTIIEEDGRKVKHRRVF